MASRFGVTVAPAPGHDLADWVHAPLFREAAASIVVNGASDEAFWRSTLPLSESPGQFIHEHLLLRITGDGTLSFRLAIMENRSNGWTLP